MINESDLNVDAQPWVPSFSAPSSPTLSSNRSSPTEEYIRSAPAPHVVRLTKVDTYKQPEIKYVRVTRPVAYIDERDQLPSEYVLRGVPRSPPQGHHHVEPHRAQVHSRHTVHHVRQTPLVHSPERYSAPGGRHAAERPYPVDMDRYYPGAVREREATSEKYNVKQYSSEHEHSRYSRQSQPIYVRPQVARSAASDYYPSASARHPAVAASYSRPMVSQARYVPDPADFIRQHYACTH